MSLKDAYLEFHNSCGLGEDDMVLINRVVVEEEFGWDPKAGDLLQNEAALDNGDVLGKRGIITADMGKRGFVVNIENEELVLPCYCLSLVEKAVVTVKKLGDYEVKYDEDGHGIKVGCQKVTTREVERVLEGCYFYLDKASEGKDRNQKRENTGATWKETEDAHLINKLIMFLKREAQAHKRSYNAIRLRVISYFEKYQTH